MRTWLLFINAILIIIVLDSSIAESSNPNAKGTCADGSWVPYADSKCFKLVQQFLTWSDASETCTALSNSDGQPTTLATIKSSEEQAFVSNYVFGSPDIANNVWIGAHLADNSSDDDGVLHFYWVDGEPLLDYTNWMEGCPSGDEKKGCVELESGLGRSGLAAGQWKDVGCSKGNWVLCQRTQSWSYDDMIASILQLRRDMEKQHNQTTNELEVQKAELVAQKEKMAVLNDELAKQAANPVPLGFVYVQLPSQPEPSTIWPNVGWTDVTSNYAGLFFRAEGGGSDTFGTNQNDQTRRVTQVQYTEEPWSENFDHFPSTATLPEGAWSDFCKLGFHPDGPAAEAMAFYTENVEVRPKNTAVRIWTRSS